MKYLGLSLVFFLLTGCAGIANMDIVDPNKCKTTQSIVGFDNIKGNVAKKVYFDIAASGDMYIDDLLPNNTTKKHTIPISEAQDIKQIFNNSVADRCSSMIARDKSEADIVIAADVKRIVAKLINGKIEGDNGVGFTSRGDMTVAATYQNVLTVDTKINGKDVYYDHSIDLDKTIRWKLVKGYYVLGASFDTDSETTFTAKLDSSPLAKGAILVKQNAGMLLVFTTMHNEMSGYIDIHDPTTLEIKKHLDLSVDDVDWMWTAQLKDELKNEVIMLYTTPQGNLRYLIHDYVMKIMEEIGCG